MTDLWVEMIMKETGCNYEDAHEKANAVYNWFDAFLKEEM